MNKFILFIALAGLMAADTAALVAESNPQPDFQASAFGYRQALTAANDSLADALGKLGRAQEQVVALQKQVADLQAQLDAVKPKTKTAPAAPKPAAPAK